MGVDVERQSRASMVTLGSTSVSVRWALVWLLCLALEAPYEGHRGVYVMYICTLRQMGVLLFKGGYPDFSFAKTISIMC